MSGHQFDDEPIINIKRDRFTILLKPKLFIFSVVNSKAGTDQKMKWLPDDPAALTLHPFIANDGVNLADD